MIVFYCLLILSIISLSVMELQDRQLLLCPHRKAMVQTQVSQSPNVCVFCDPMILAQNYIINEDEESNVRIMMNQLDFDPIDSFLYLKDNAECLGTIYRGT